MERATQALLQADLVLAEQVITNHDELSRMQTQAEEAAFVLLALQAPVAGDLRLVVGSMQNVADAERMGGLANTRRQNRSSPTPRACSARRGAWVLRRDGHDRGGPRQQCPGGCALA